MAEPSWLRFFGANRARQHGLKSRPSEAALHDTLEDATRSKEARPKHGKGSMVRLASSQGLSQTYRGTAADAILDEADREFINVGQHIWHNPSVDQLVEDLRAAVMATEANEPLSAKYRPHVLLLCEFYGTRHDKIAKLESQLAEAKDTLEKETKRHNSIEEHWMVQDARFRAEVKRLEMFIHRTSSKGMEAVVLARAGSLIRNKPRDIAKEPTSIEGNITDAPIGSSDTTPQNTYTETSLDSALPTRQGTVLSRTRTTDTSNEVRLSHVFRKLEETKSTASGARRTEAQDVDPGKTHHSHHRAGQCPRSDSVLPIGSNTCDTVEEPPHEEKPEEKRGSTEKAATLQEAGVLRQPSYAEITSAHEHRQAKQDRVLENKPTQTSQKAHARHRRQFSFVPGDDKTAVQLFDAKAAGSPPVAQNENSQVLSTGRQTARLGRQTKRSRSTEWI